MKGDRQQRNSKSASCAFLCCFGLSAQFHNKRVHVRDCEQRS